MREVADSSAVTVGANGFTVIDPALLPLPAAVDSLSVAIDQYRDVEDAHRRGLVGCRALLRAHARVVNANTRVGISRDAVTGTLDLVDSLRVSMTRAEYTHISQMHRRSGCQG